MEIKININQKIASLANPADEIICNNWGYTLSFAFDEEWEDYPLKTARVSYQGEHRDILFSGTECTLPPIPVDGAVEIGVFAGDLQTSAPATVFARRSVLTEAGSPAAPEEDVYAQLMEAVSGLGLPKAGEENEGKVLTVANGVWTAKELPVYEGAYSVLSGQEALTLQTAGTYLTGDIRVEPVCVTLEENDAGGQTLVIGEEGV